MRTLFVSILLVVAGSISAQKHSDISDFFIDGYHGGIYGHYPMWVTKFVADNMDRNKDWRINLEIEPATWDVVAKEDPDNYERLKKIINTSSPDATAEYVNPTYAQSYLFNSSVESTIRQFQFGMAKLRQHFPLIQFTTYSSEEPCFTSALPQILRSLGIRYASLKNPNTCWGGYVKAHGGQLINWVGPDSTSVLTVPRYRSEALEKNSTWQTIAWNQSPAFLNGAIEQGIEYPVGMCLQDAGWRNGPWLDKHKASSTAYSTWRNYFINFGENGAGEDWQLSQEDIRVSLMWGTQVLQRISQQIRSAENQLRSAEKMAALATLYRGLPYPKAQFDSAWTNILLSQHHDCWIVPYNRLSNTTWAEHVKEWTEISMEITRKIIDKSIAALSPDDAHQSLSSVFIYNPTSFNRKEATTVSLPIGREKHFAMTHQGRNIPFQILKQDDSSSVVLFIAEAPAMGSTRYDIHTKERKSIPDRKESSISRTANGDYKLETDLYKIVVDAQKGSIKQLRSKKSNHQDLVLDQGSNFNTLRGYFYNEEKFIHSFDQKPEITILENGPIRVKLEISGKIDDNRFVQTIQLTAGEKRIDMALKIDYSGKTGIGDDYKQHHGYDAREYRKSFYNDTSKLIVRLPLNLDNRKIYKDAPLDVTESRLQNTFYNSWDQIKNNIIFNWIDIVDSVNNYGMALLSDHVTSYSYGENFPLSLTVQYAGIGLWGRNYNVNGPTKIKYALIPHEGNWLRADINREAVKWNEPLIVQLSNTNVVGSQFVNYIDPGLSISSIYYEGSDLYIRIMNTGSDKTNHRVSLNCFADSIDFVELNNDVKQSRKLNPGKPVSFECAIPLFGFSTIRINGVRR